MLSKRGHKWRRHVLYAVLSCEVNMLYSLLLFYSQQHHLYIGLGIIHQQWLFFTYTFLNSDSILFGWSYFVLYATLVSLLIWYNMVLLNDHKSLFMFFWSLQPYIQNECKQSVINGALNVISEASSLLSESLWPLTFDRALRQNQISLETVSSLLTMI